MRFGTRTGAEIRALAAQHNPMVKLGGGHHTYYGILILCGDGIRPASPIKGACVYDVAPTILYLMGSPVPADMDGRVLAEIVEDSWLKARAVEKVLPEGTEEEGERVAYTDEDEKIIADRLRGLGYVD
jgi:hypothetical protein